MSNDPISYNDSPDPLSTNSLCYWVLELQAGRSNAAEPVFKKIVAAVESRTKHAFRKFLRVGRFADLNDVIQGSMVRLLKTMRAIRPDSTRHFYALVNTAIRRELLDLIKKYFGSNGPGCHLSPGALNIEAIAEVSSSEDPYTELERMSAFHKAVENLPAEEREAFGLMYYHGWKQEEIANLFQVSVRTIHRWQKDAAVLLRKQLGPS